MLIFLFAFLFASTNAYSRNRTLIKYWITDESAMGCWTFTFIDQWGGENYQCKPCIIQGCTLWSWSARYELDGIHQSDPCPQNNTVEYGETLSRNQAAQDGENVPDSTVFTFSIEEIIE